MYVCMYTSDDKIISMWIFIKSPIDIDCVFNTHALPVRDFKVPVYVRMCYSRQEKRDWKPS